MVETYFVKSISFPEYKYQNFTSLGKYQVAQKNAETNAC